MHILYILRDENNKKKKNNNKNEIIQNSKIQIYKFIILHVSTLQNPTSNM